MTRVARAAAVAVAALLASGVWGCQRGPADPTDSVAPEGASVTPAVADAAEREVVRSAAGDTTAGADPAPDYAVDFLGRRIDLRPYVLGFPYERFMVDVEHGHLLYRERRPDRTVLLHQPLGERGTVALDTGRELTSVDWSERNFWRAVFHPPSGRFYAFLDRENEERMNVWTIDPRTGAIEQITDNDYTYGYTFSDDDRYLGYIARNGTEEPFDSCLHVLDTTTGHDRRILCDGGGVDRFTWSSVLFAPSNDFAVVRIQHDGDRNKTNLARVDLTAPDGSAALDFLLPREVLRYGVWAISETVTEDRVYYVSEETGFGNIYRHDFASEESEQLTSFEDEISGVAWVPGERPLFVVTLKRPHESEALLLDAGSGEVLFRDVRDVSLSLSDFHGDRGVARYSSVDAPFAMERWLVERPEGEPPSLTTEPLAGVPSELEEEIVQCDVRRITFPTFDQVATGEPRGLHAFYYAPRAPRPEPERLVRITAFYGGGNGFSTSSHIMCEAGVATLSPSPRGSWGFGAEFAALNDGDLGGDEIIDLFYAARWLEEAEGYEPSQIGVYGGSHGGYATMRALTFPPDTNDRGEEYPFGFGLSHAGFSDIVSFYESSNIPDWVILEAGDPETELDKLRDRSPLSHVERLRAPILLTHGSNDSRVPVAESRRFAQRAESLGRPVTYVEFEGQGHGISGLANTVRYYRAVFGFLESVVEMDGGPRDR